MRRHRESGQAMVETAIVMPFFVFLILGLLQLMLLHQGRLLVKYAAYKATRAGSVNRANKGAMRKAALGVLMPMVTRTNGETLYKLDGAMSYTTAWNLSRLNRYLSSGVKMVDVTICNPDSSMLTENDDFDSPLSSRPSGGGGGLSADWKGMDRTRLATQVTFNQPMVIPFANGVLWYMMLGTTRWSSGNTEMMQTLRLKNRRASAGEKGATASVQSLWFAARMGNYYAPIRGTWSMRMMSNVLRGELPGSNQCKAPFK